MKRNPLLLLLLLLVAGIAVGDFFWPYGPFRTAPEWPATPQTWNGVVTQQPRPSGKVVRAVVRLTNGGALVQLTAAVDSASITSPDATSDKTATALAVGDRVVFHGRIEEPHNAGNPGETDYAAYLRHQGISGQTFCYAQQWRSMGRASHLTLAERMLVLRNKLTASFSQHFEGEALSIVSAMTLGDRSRVDRSVRELYSRTGSSHILALSGLHLSILFGLFAIVILRPLQRWGRAGKAIGGVLLLLTLWTFVLLAGLPVSLVRAATMLTIVTLLQLLGRHTAPPFHSLVVTLIVMLLCWPQMLFDVGLQLSAVSVASIIGLTHAMNLLQNPAKLVAPWHVRQYIIKMRPGTQRKGTLEGIGKMLMTLARSVGRAVLMLVLVSFTAQLVTMPIVSHYFGRIAMGGSITSLVVIPAAYCILVGGMIYLLLMALPAAWGSLLASGIARALTLIVNVVHSVLGAVAEWPMATFDVQLSWWGVAFSFALMMWSIHIVRTCFRMKGSIMELRGRRVAYAFRGGAVALLMLVLLVGGEKVIGVMTRPNVGVVVYNRPGRMEVHCVTPTTDSIVTPASRYMVGNVLCYAGQKVAVVNAALPYVGDIEMPDALVVDALLISRGAKGHLSDMLMRYNPSLVVLDGSLNDYYRTRFAEETAAAGLPLYDVKDQGALTLEAKSASSDSQETKK